MSAVASVVEEIFTSERPWGSFEQFVQNRQVTVKIITVLPGHRLSRQKHNHRAELWHVLDCPIVVEVEGDEWTAAPGEQVWVPRGAIHRISNSGTQSGRLLEIAFGAFDEGDIERLDDDYLR